MKHMYPTEHPKKHWDEIAVGLTEKCTEYQNFSLY